jgi:hypothetical protein
MKEKCFTPKELGAKIVQSASSPGPNPGGRILTLSKCILECTRLISRRVLSEYSQDPGGRIHYILRFSVFCLRFSMEVAPDADGLTVRPYDTTRVSL